MTLAELRELCERDCGEDFAAGILADEQIAAAARTWLPALIEVAEAAHAAVEDEGPRVTRKVARLRDALARLDEVGQHKNTGRS